MTDRQRSTGHYSPSLLCERVDELRGGGGWEASRLPAVKRVIRESPTHRETCDRGVTDSPLNVRSSSDGRSTVRNDGTCVPGSPTSEGKKHAKPHDRGALDGRRNASRRWYLRVTPLSRRGIETTECTCKS